MERFVEFSHTKIQGRIFAKKGKVQQVSWSCGNTSKLIIIIRMKLGVTPIPTKLCVGRLRWFGHVQRKASDAPVRKVKSITIDGERCRRRPKKSVKTRITVDRVNRVITGITFQENSNLNSKTCANESLVLKHS